MPIHLSVCHTTTTPTRIYTSPQQSIINHPHLTSPQYLLISRLLSFSACSVLDNLRFQAKTILILIRFDLFNIKHNTYSRIESFDGITSIGENLSKTEKYKGTILIKVFIWVTVLLRIFFQVNSITQNFCFEIFFWKADNVTYLQTNCRKKNYKWVLKIFQLGKLFRLALFVSVFQL